MEESRTRNSIKNFFISIGVQIIGLVSTVINRTIFVNLLNIEYLGLNGLFSNIITILSFAELGLGSAIIFSLYQAIHNNDEKKISALMNLYRTAYRYIAVVVAVVGIAIIPFLDFIIKGKPDIQENINIIYVMFLVNSVTSYLFSYKKAILTASQKDYVVVVWQQIIHIVQTILQALFLLLTHNYIIYLAIQIVCTLLTDLILYNKVDKSYLYLKKYSSVKLDRSERKSIFANIRALFQYKLGSIILNASDAVIISSILGLTAVGVCSNFILVIATIETIVSKALNGIVASIGNLNASSDINLKRNIFEILNLISYWIYGFVSISLFLLLNPLVKLWLGDSYMLSEIIVFAMALRVYVTGINFTPSSYRITMGFFKEAMFTPVVASVINIVLAIILGNEFGLVGIFIATSIARALSFGIVDPILVIRKGLNQKCAEFYFKQVMHFVILFFNGFVCRYIINLITLNGLMGLICKTVIVCIVCNVIYVLIFCRTKIFKEIVNKILGSVR